MRRRLGLSANIPVPVRQVPAGEEGGPESLPNLLKEEEKEEDGEEKKEDYNDDEEMEGKMRDEEDMQDSLVVQEGIMIKFSLVSYATFLLPLQLLLQGSFHQEVKQPHPRDAQRPNIRNYLVPSEAPAHLPLTTRASHLANICCGVPLFWYVLKWQYTSP